MRSVLDSDAIRPADTESDHSVDSRYAATRLTGPTPGRRGRIAAGWLLALVLIGGCGVQQQAAPTCSTPTEADMLAERLFRLINLERSLEDLDPLVWDATLARVSQAYACRMIEGDFLEHIDPDTKAGPNHRLTLAGYEFTVMGENLARGHTTVVEVIDGWMASPAHRDNILSPEWTEIGIGVRTDEEGTVYWVLEFADPA